MWQNLMVIKKGMVVEDLIVGYLLQIYQDFWVYRPSRGSL